MDELIERLAKEIGERASTICMEHIAEAADAIFKDGFKLVWTEEQAAQLLECSERKLYDAAKAKEIDSTTNPAGRRVYMLHHLIDYLVRNETDIGRRTIQMADVLRFPGADTGKRRTGT